MTTVSSNFHVEMNPSDVGNNDRYVVQEIIKVNLIVDDRSRVLRLRALHRGLWLHLQDMARSRPIDTTGQKGFKVLVLDEVDRISKEAQHSLRRTMEKYSAACRLVLCCNNVSKVRMAGQLCKRGYWHVDVGMRA